MGIPVGVVGGAGYAGAELLRLLSAHPGFTVKTVCGAGTAGRSLADVFPALGLDLAIAPAAPEALAGCEVVFLATPHEVSLELVPPLLSAGAAVVDLSAAYRLDAETFTAAYGLPHTSPQLAPAAYGLPELFRKELIGVRLVANPGCYPTASLLALAPVAELIVPDSVVIAGLSGTSGAGKGLRDDLHISHALHNVMAYGAPSHRHTPEIGAWLSLLTGAGQQPVTFTPHLIPMTRGLVCTATADLRDDLATDDLQAAITDTYAGEPFVRVAAGWPQTAHVQGCNVAIVGGAVDAAAGRVTISCAIDNLGKGAAGQALQNANVICGLPEVTGLPTAAVYP
jgi:N-acetyl-gamma-glutamyl-phosphate reductase